MKRRQFLQRAGTGGLLLASGAFPLGAMTDPETLRLTILHTNDVHSRIEAFPMDGGRNQGLGGVARRATMIRQIREKSDWVLLFDAGDIFQGTPYFNFFGGEPEIRAMSAMGYDAATIGNHDFDGGIDGLEKQLPNAVFPFVICNYDFSDTILNGKTRPYQVFEKRGVRIGVTGVGIELAGLVPQSLYGATRYLDPLDRANEVAALLREEENCDFVVVLSHLGYAYRDSARVSDKTLAANSRNIDLIIGGHTHTFLEEPTLVKDLDGKAVIINQVGWGGILLGRLDVHFERNKKGKCVTCKNDLFVR